MGILNKKGRKENKCQTGSHSENTISKKRRKGKESVRANIKVETKDLSRKKGEDGKKRRRKKEPRSSPESPLRKKRRENEK